MARQKIELDTRPPISNDPEFEILSQSLDGHLVHTNGLEAQNPIQH